MFHRLLTGFIALVWFANGLLAKVLGLLPRHEAIVGRILGPEYADVLTILIGLSEIAVGFWVLTGLRRRITAALQIGIVLSMNLLETVLAPDLLLWGHWNLLFAVLFCGLLYYHGFHSQPSRDAA